MPPHDGSQPCAPRSDCHLQERSYYARQHAAASSSCCESEHSSSDDEQCFVAAAERRGQQFGSAGPAREQGARKQTTRGWPFAALLVESSEENLKPFQPLLPPRSLQLQSSSVARRHPPATTTSLGLSVRLASHQSSHTAARPQSQAHSAAACPSWPFPMVRRCGRAHGPCGPDRAGCCMARFLQDFLVRKLFPSICQWGKNVPKFYIYIYIYIYIGGAGVLLILFLPFRIFSRLSLDL
jgi:hypothetical protein